MIVACEWHPQLDSHLSLSAQMVSVKHTILQRDGAVKIGEEDDLWLALHSGQRVEGSHDGRSNAIDTIKLSLLS